MEHRDPTTLRPHPAIKAWPRWAKESEGWRAFVDDIRAHGITHPVQVTSDDTVVDGWTRVLAARALQLAQVPVVVVQDSEATDIILRNLALRRNLTKGQLAYVAYPVVETAYEEHRAAHLEALKKGNAATIAHSVRNGTGADLAERFGVSRRLFDQARELHSIWAEHPDLREQFEASIFHAEKPAGLGAVVAGARALIRQRQLGRHGGGRPESQDRQLKLFNGVVKDLVTRWEYWHEFDDGARTAHWQVVRAHAAKLPPAQCEEMAEYHQRMAKVFAQAAKEGVA